MAAIQSSTGLVTGINIQDTVEKLMKVASASRDNLNTATTALKTQQTAVTELSALLLSVQYVTKNLGKATVYEKQKATSSNESVLKATVTGSPVSGTYQYTPLQIAQSEQWLSSGVANAAAALGGGTVAFRFGASVERDVNLSDLNGGAGFSRGKIRITDRSGASAEIDLTAAQTVGDVLDAINSNASINVTAVAQGDHLQLIDNTGQTVSNLKVQEVGRGTTAASLGLSGINVASSTGNGSDLVSLTADTRLSVLNDGNGFHANTVMADVAYTLRDGTTGEIDFSPVLGDGVSVDAEATIGDVLDVINAAAPGKLKAEIGADGKRIVVTDLTAGGGSFTLTSEYGSSALHDLGLESAAQNGVVTGRRLMGGLQTVLLASLNGGKCLGDLGALNLTDRGGTSASVDLSEAETLEDVVTKINAKTAQSGVGITAQLNEARNGIVLVDTTGQTASNLIVASGDGTGTAEKLNLVANAAETSVNSGDLHLQVVGWNTQLSTLNGGTGVGKGTITFYDSNGASGKIDLSKNGISTVGDVIQAINRLNLSLTAGLNDTGDGIVLKDAGTGGKTIRVEEGNSTAAADLHLLGAATTQTIDGTATQVVDGAMTQKITLNAGESLEALADKINALDAGVTAQIFNDGSSTPYRLLLTSKATGKTSQMVVDTAGLDLGVDRVTKGRDALLAMGTSSLGGLIMASSNNQFTGAISGVTLEVKQATTSPVTISIESTDSDFVASVKTLIANYNKFREKLNDGMAYNSETDKKAVLTGDGAALRLDTELSAIFSGRTFYSGPYRSVADLGIDIKDDGTLELDENKLKEAFAGNRDAVQKFFTDEENGFSVKIDTLIDQLAGEDNSLLAKKLSSLSARIDDNKKRLDFMQQRLDIQEERLYLQYYNLEIAVAKIQSNQTYLDTLESIASWYSSKDK